MIESATSPPPEGLEERVNADAHGSAAQPMLASLIELEIRHLALQPGDHLCAFYRGARDRDEILAGYLAKGLENGEKCICVLDVAERRELTDRLRAHLALCERHRQNQLEILDCSDTYLRGGRFSQDEWFEFLDRSVDAAINGEGYPVARVAGEMGWALHTSCPRVGDLIAYEAKVNWFAPRYPQILMCLYDLERFSGEIIVDILKTHPRVLIHDTIIENPYYVSPEAFFAKQGSRGEAPRGSGSTRPRRRAADRPVTAVAFEIAAPVRGAGTTVGA